MAPATRARDGSMPAAALALDASTDMYWCPATLKPAPTLPQLWLMAG
jgi:hypothetical protein